VSALQPKTGLRLKPEPTLLGLVLVVLVAATSGVAAPAQSPACNATPLRYEWNQRAGGRPWIAVGPTHSRLEAWLVTYDAYVADARVNRSEHMIVRAGVEEKIGWRSWKWGGTWLNVTGRLVAGDGSLTQRFRAAWGTHWYPSGLKVPAAGCWELTLRTQRWTRRVVVEAIEPPASGTCDATPVPEAGLTPLTPRRSGLRAAWGWRSPDGGALLYPGGRTPEGGNTKILWSTTRDASHASGQLVLRGEQLDGNGTFRQTFSEVFPLGHWPSIPIVPNPGCWLFTARIAGQQGAAGILVVRVV
jgi:hypothetical protein